MKNKGVLVIVIILFMLPTAILAQNNSDDSEATVEELYLGNIEVMIIKEQAFSEDRDMKLLALENLESMIGENRVGEGDIEVHAVLEYLSLEGVGVQIRENRRLTNYFPEIRRRACNILGQLGGQISIDSLINVIIADEEPMVLSEAAYALGQIGKNENNQSTQAIAYALLSQDIMIPDNNFAFAALLAFEKIANYNGELSDPSAFRAIVRIAQGNYLKTVKLKANEVMNILRSLN